MRKLTGYAWHQSQSIQSLNFNFLSSQQLIDEFVDNNEFLILIFDTQAACTDHTNLSPRQITLLACTRSAKTEALRASIGI